MDRLTDIPETLPVWMNRGEPLTLAHATVAWWQRVYDWLTFPLAQIDVDTCDERLLGVLAYQRDVSRFPGESLALFRLRVKYAFVNALDAGSKAGFARIFERLDIGTLIQLERQLQYDWDVILLRINDEQLSRDNVLMMHLVRQYGRTCRRYFFDVLNSATVYTCAGQFDHETCHYAAKTISRPTSIIAMPETLSLMPGERQTVTVDVLPEDAEDRSFSAWSSDTAIATVQQHGDTVTVTGVALGEATVTLITNANGLTATLSVAVVAATRFVVRIDNLSRGLFHADISETGRFTIDYGDGIDSLDYAHNASTGMVTTTRTLTVGAKYTLTVKNSNTLMFYWQTGTYNPLLEVVRVVSDRTDMSHFVRGRTTLHTLHPGAFDGLPNVTTFAGALRGCTGLTALPGGLFDACTQVSDFSYLLYGCTGLTTLPPDLFGYHPRVTTLYGAFYGCTALSVLPDGLFAHTPAVTDLAYAFYGCTALTALPVGLFDAMTRVTTFANAFQRCTALKTLPDGLFTACVNVTTFASAFTRCRALTALPPRLFAGLSLVTTVQSAFQDCAALATLGAQTFSGCVSVTNVHSLFRDCAALTHVPTGLFDDCVALTGLPYSFYGCSALTTVGDGAFDAMLALTQLTYTFQGCAALTGDLNAILTRETYPALTSVAHLFSGCGQLTGRGLDVIDKFTGTVTHNAALHNCVSLDDYDALPDTWITAA